MRITRIASTARMDLAASIVPAKATLTIFGYIGDAQGFTTTRDGIYAAAGAQGSNSNDQGGFGGAPASAIVTLPNGVELTILIGGKGGSDDSSPFAAVPGVAVAAASCRRQLASWPLRAAAAPSTILEALTSC